MVLTVAIFGLQYDPPPHTHTHDSRMCTQLRLVGFACSGVVVRSLTSHCVAHHDMRRERRGAAGAEELMSTALLLFLIGCARNSEVVFAAVVVFLLWRPLAELLLTLAFTTCGQPPSHEPTYNNLEASSDW